VGSVPLERQAAPVSESVFVLLVILFPTIGGLSAAATVYILRWRRARAKRRLDEMFEADREWWEEQFRGTK
jgi:uncharacterized membrane protein